MNIYNLLNSEHHLGCRLHTETTNGAIEKKEKSAPLTIDMQVGIFAHYLEIGSIEGQQTGSDEIKANAYTNQGQG